MIVQLAIIELTFGDVKIRSSEISSLVHRRRGVDQKQDDRHLVVVVAVAVAVVVVISVVTLNFLGKRQQWIPRDQLF